MADFPKTSFYGEGQTDLRGPKGDKGDRGEQGDLGPRGPQGFDGAKGDPGTNGADGSNGANGKNAYYRFGTFAVSGIQEGEILLDHVVVQACTLGVDFAGSSASCGVAPETDWIATLSRNGVVVGYIQVATSGVTTLSTIAPTPVLLGFGDTFTITAPDDPDTQIGRLRVTFSGEL